MKTGIVIEGGGMKCAYTAGILDCLMENGIQFSYAIGVSAGAACMASFLAGQEDRNRRFFVEHVLDPQYIGFSNYRKTGNYFGLEYIYKELANSDGADPLDYEALQSNPTEFFVVATDAATGSAHYFSRDDIPRDDYRVFMASSAIPAACKPVEINGNLYFDGGVSDPLPVKHALMDGCDRLLILLCRPRNTIRSQQKRLFLINRLIRKYPDIQEAIRYRHKYYNDSLLFARKLEAERRAFILAPKEPLPVGTYTKDPAVLQGIYETALTDFKDTKRSLFEFLEG
ncbi:MAG: patatin family protein [Lachnospiraceae bacterium]|nr:patatin family protein [Lachnospiraceae bacterium]